MTLAERIAEIEATIAAIIDGKSGWPSGLWDPALKRLEATAEAFHLTDQELRELSDQYQLLTDMHVGTTSASLQIEIARRSTLSAHQRMAETMERARIREC